MIRGQGGRLRLAGLASLVTVSVVLAVVFPAWADYLGPNRTVSTWVWQRRHCRYQAVYDPPGPGWYGCSLDQYDSPDTSCAPGGSVADYFTTSACSWPEPFCAVYGCDIGSDASIESCSEGQIGCRAVEHTVTQPEATVGGSVACAISGEAGWCRSGAELALTGSEPLAGYAILALEGTRNGETFACAGATCSVGLAEGGNNFQFWAVSSWGDTSRMGSASGNVDTQSPVISSSLTGTSGANGWFVSEVTVSAEATDPAPGSGLASLQVALDGGGWTTYTGPASIGEGSHTLDLLAADVAGNSSTEG